MLKYQHSGSEAMPTTQKTISSVDSCGPVGDALEDGRIRFDDERDDRDAEDRVHDEGHHSRSLSTDLSFVNIDITVVR